MATGNPSNEEQRAIQFKGFHFVPIYMVSVLDCL